MGYRDECRRPIRTWLKSVEADMAELEIEEKMSMSKLCTQAN